jgi:sialate O-acetylesterase
MTLKLPHTGMAVTTDIGDPNDIHPRNKQDVGKRLALIALAQTYGQEIEYSGPMYSTMTIEKGGKDKAGKVRVRFKHADGLAAAAPGEPLVGFEVAGRDHRYVAAEAHIDGDSVVLSAPTVPAPVAARYAWSDAPLGNLVNRAGLPASPFRTDTWPGLTLGRK